MTNGNIRSDIIPNKSVGLIKLGDEIRNYLHLNYVLTPAVVETDNSITDLYEFKEPPLSAFVNRSGLIESISCHSTCSWKERELIGLQFETFLELIELKPDDEDEIYLENADGNGQYQKAYDFLDLGLQIWVSNGKIATVSCTDYNSSDYD